MNKDEIFKKMTQEEKCKLFVGKNFWELEPIEGKSVFLSDGPHGIRKEIQTGVVNKTVEAICYPAACLSACSFDTKLLKELGEQLGKEGVKNDIDVLLGPGINIKRNPRCGRNFEYFSEDPLLAGKLAASYINGVQEQGIGTSLKHFALNSQEQARFINDSIVDERTMREIYLKGFEIAVKESNPTTIMASYNVSNEIHSTENEHMLNDILRKEFGFKGLVMSDWGAINDPVESIKNGLDLEMPGISKGSEFMIRSAIANGKLEQKYLDESTKRKIDLYLRTHGVKSNDFDHKCALKIAKKINDESIVLLKNDAKILPIDRKSSIALIGDFAKHPRIQGGGSSVINATDVTNLYDEFTKEKLDFEYAQGYVSEDLKPKKKLIREACDVAKDKDVVVIMAGLPMIIESEGYDRDDLKMSKSQLELIEEVSKVNENVVVVLQNGSPIEIPFEKDVKGILEAYLGGSMHATSIKDILIGKVNPSGRLAETFPLKYEDVPSAKTYLSNPYYSMYKEGIYVGYRYYDTFGRNVLYPFGYGLTYSDIYYSKLHIEQKEDRFIARFTLTNESKYPCKEVVQLYVGELNPTIFKARKELKAFDKIELKAHEEKQVTLEVMKSDLAYYSTKQNKWCLEEGKYRFYLAKDATDESNFYDVDVASNDKKEDLREELGVYYKMNEEISDETFFKLLGRTPKLTHKKKPFTLESPIIDVYHSFLGFFAVTILKTALLSQIKDPVEKKCYKMSIPYQPLRSIQMIGGLSKYNILGLVEIFNGHLIKGIKMLKSKDNVIK